MLKSLGQDLRKDGMGKLTIQDKIDGKRSRGRSSVRNIDQIKNLTHLSVEEIMKTVEDMKTWQSLRTPA